MQGKAQYDYNLAKSLVGNSKETVLERENALLNAQEDEAYAKQLVADAQKLLNDKSG